MNGEQLAARFDADRPHLQAVAYRLLGSASEAEDAVQDAWFRLEHSDVGSINNLTGWLTTVVARICLDMLRSRKSRREDPLPEDLDLVDADDPAGEVVLTDAVGEAMMALLEHLSPGERVAFVLHDVFAIPFDDIAPILDRSPAAVRQLASRGRRRVRSMPPSGQPVTNPDRKLRVINAFHRASKAGDFQALLAVLAPDVALRADATTLRMGARNGWLVSELDGPDAVATQFDGQAQAAQLAMIDGEPGLVWAPGGTVRAVFRIEVHDDLIVGINLSSDPDVVAAANVTLLA